MEPTENLKTCLTQVFGSGYKCIPDYDTILQYALGNKEGSSWSCDFDSREPQQYYNINSINIQCISCFFGHRCTENNSCVLGTDGPTCERCSYSNGSSASTGYLEVGSSCVPCMSMSWPVLGLGTAMAVTLLSSLVYGFTASVSTKVQQLWEYMQLMLLTLSIKMSWPQIIALPLQFFTFSVHAVNVFAAECFLPRSMKLQYIEWAGCLLIPVILLAFMVTLDKYLVDAMEKESESLVKQKLWKRRRMLRRLVWLALVLLYVPVTRASARSQACSSSVPMMTFPGNESSDLFLYDQEESYISCSDIIFQVFHVAGTCSLVLVSVVGPAFLILYTLRQRKWDILEKSKILYGPLYEAYTSRFCFWLPVSLLRRFLLIILADIYVFSVLIQLIVHLSVSVLFLSVVAIGRPYRKCIWSDKVPVDINIVFEVLSGLSVGLLQTTGLLHHLFPAAAWLSYVDAAFLASVPVTIIFWVFTMIMVNAEKGSPVQEQPHDLSESELAWQEGSGGGNAGPAYDMIKKVESSEKDEGGSQSHTSVVPPNREVRSDHSEALGAAKASIRHISTTLPQGSAKALDF